MKKVIILLGTLLLTGCGVNYNLRYENEMFKEEIVINDYSNNYDVTGLPYIEDLEKNGFYADYDETFKYDQSIKKDKDVYDINLKASYHGNEYQNSNILRSCFEFYDFKEEEDYYYVSAYGAFYCKYADTINFNFTSPYVVIYHNATKVKGNKYIWNVDKLDQNKMEIRLQISKTQLAKKRGYGLLLFYLIIIGMFGYGYSKYRKDPSMFNKLQSKVSKVFKKNQ